MVLNSLAVKDQEQNQGSTKQMKVCNAHLKYLLRGRPFSSIKYQVFNLKAKLFSFFTALFSMDIYNAKCYFISDVKRAKRTKGS